MTAIVGGVMSLQALRNELVLNAARREAAAQERQAQQAQQNVTIPPGVVPADYGSIVRPH
jgi:hypothetical protein